MMFSRSEGTICSTPSPASSKHTPLIATLSVLFARRRIVAAHSRCIIPPQPDPRSQGSRVEWILKPGPEEAQKMADSGNQEFPTVIGPDASFKGELSFE